MDSCDVLIVGERLRVFLCVETAPLGLDVLILDKHTFPRDKVCGGWITPPVLDELEIDPQDYARRRSFQPIAGFRASRMGDPEVETNYGKTISYGIRRYEFDDYLLKKCGARMIAGVPLKRHCSQR